MQICQEVKRSFPSAIEHDGLREENSIAVDAKAGLQARRFDFHLISHRSEKGQPLLVHQLKSCTDDLRHRLKSAKDLAGGFLILEHDGRSAIVRRDFTDDGELVRGLLSKRIGLEAE